MNNVPYETYDRHIVNIFVVHTPQLPKSKPHQLLLLTIIGLWLLAEGKNEGVDAAPQSCVLCDKNDLKTAAPSQPAYEEFLFEHQVTRQEAIGALRALNDTFYTARSCSSLKCTKNVMKYCLSPQFINDHCWCEQGHVNEGLPFVPHICYVGEKIYTTSAGSCFFYEEVKECCCGPALAKQWRHISAASSLNMELVTFLWLLTISNVFLLVNVKM